ncbi:uncharacterized protein GGS22DRAFT_199228 [Annulohypoxylon maeteangense]|uniref:uncharacterized protein n=1 Tax=Annulohypoxylon maeteangense TaxID=1927788 RepID=UPI0020072A58|nr:uncharacterized protein GGS22DRAFT_199228 [Annulohypoxylon maeteangense]KAI0886907.1 hypothetical protein GGS22DRAFT_199228 [Annulohypoxylon maeteangense]
MPYIESFSKRETAHLDGSVNQGNASSYPEFIEDGGVSCYNSQNLQEPPHLSGSSLAQDHESLGTTSTSATVYNNNSGSTYWYEGGGLYFAEDPLVLESDQTVDNSVFGDIHNWLNDFRQLTNDSTSTAGTRMEENQSGYSYPPSPVQSQSVKEPSFPLPTDGPKRLRRVKCEQCGKLFAKTNDLKRHYECVHSTDGPKYRCICGHAQPRKDNHKRHACSCENAMKHQSYSCKCNTEHVDKQAHLDHVKQCSATFYGCAGRPRLNSAIAQ